MEKFQNPHGFIGGSAIKPCLSTRGEGGSKIVKNLSTWFMNDPKKEFPLILNKKWKF